MHNPFLKKSLPVFAVRQAAISSESLTSQDSGPDPVDIHVGKRLRTLRKLKSISQEKLAKSLGLTFQQVQKYERADNRIGASRLYHIAQALAVPVSYFYKGVEGESDSPTYGFAEDGADDYSDIMERPETVKLVQLYYQIKDEDTRKQLIETIKLWRKK
jgi:transcriptional regulator with XRE-family HTH domain